MERGEMKQLETGNGREVEKRERNKSVTRTQQKCNKNVTKT